jgi:hypothetical protein
LINALCTVHSSIDARTVSVISVLGQANVLELRYGAKLDAQKTVDDD